MLMFSQVIIKIVGLIYKLYLTNKEGFGDRGNAIYGGAFQKISLMITRRTVFCFSWKTLANEVLKHELLLSA